MILFGNPMIYLAKYMMLYMLTVVVVYATYKCHLIVAVFYTTKTYCLQNGAAQVWAIFTDEKIMGNMGNNISKTVISCSVILAFYKISECNKHGRKLHGEEYRWKKNDINGFHSHSCDHSSSSDHVL